RAILNHMAQCRPAARPCQRLSARNPLDRPRRAVTRAVAARGSPSRSDPRLEPRRLAPRGCRYSGSVIRGAHIERMLMAGAAGDCIGFHAEGRAPPVSIPEGEWRVSDDTLLTLATCEGILRGGGVTPEAIAAGLVDAFRRRRIPGLGASTLRALRALDEGAHWAAAGRPGERAAGNGAAMRIAPLALFVTGESEEERRLV